MISVNDGAIILKEEEMISLIFICNIMSTYSFILRDTYNIFLKDNVNYKVDLVLNEDDYEMIDKNQMKDFSVDKTLFSEFDEMARKEYNKIINKNLNSDSETVAEKGFQGRDKLLLLPTYFVTKKKKLRSMRHLNTHAIKKREIVKENEAEYNYNDFLNEYYEQADNDGVLQDTSEMSEYGVINSLKRIFLPRHEHSNYNKSIGLLALKGLFDDYKKQRRLKIDIAYRLWRIIQIWFLVYMVFAVPLWCTRGWCCCCLFCKFFKPRETIEAAKKYLISNPPGVFKTKNGEVHYEPTEREKETYEQFDHFLKTN